MLDLLETYCYDGKFDSGDSSDTYRAKRKAFARVLPKIMERELTEKQSVCLRYKYLDGLTQGEIADLLKVSQPTVSRHITTAKDIVNNSLKYCYLALTAGLDEYDRLAQ